VYAARVSRLDRIRTQVDRALLLVNALRTAEIAKPIRPTRLAHFVRSAKNTKLGLHLAVMFQAAAHPDKEAFVEYGARGVKRMTWGEVDATINRLAHALVARGAGGGSHVALMLPNCIEYLIAQHALARIGATAVQIGTRLKPGEVAYILNNARPKVTIVDAQYLETMRDARGKASHDGGVIVVGGTDDANDWGRVLAAAPADAPPRSREGNGGGVIVYTSGTTGKPKGANRSWRKTGFDSVADMIVQVGLSAHDRHLVTCPLYHSAAPAFVALLMSLGATIVVQQHWDAEQCLQIMQQERITSTLMVPTMFTRLCALPPETLAKYDTSSLRWVLSGAAPLSTETARRFMEHFGPLLWNFYGSTETGFVTLAGPEDHLSHPGTIGRALRGNLIRLLDSAGNAVPPGQVGELYARNKTMITGYHGNEAATRESQRDGFFSVGDLARVDEDGFYYLESRTHDMVISGGVNIYPREIEDHLHNHPAILEAAVIGVPDAEWGESLRAFVVLRNGAHLNETEVIDYCRQGLADYKRPKRVTFLVELPRNPTGKVLKRELREIA
jgi:fatty-acyl-CoA synthase